MNVIPRGFPIPYHTHFGMLSYQICGCCGYEFGAEDDPGPWAIGLSFEDYLDRWLAAGGIWFDGKIRPSSWTFEQQMQDLAIVRPILDDHKSLSSSESWKGKAPAEP